VFLLFISNLNGQKLDSLKIDARAQHLFYTVMNTNTLDLSTEIKFLEEASSLYSKCNNWPMHIHSKCALASYSYIQGKLFDWSQHMEYLALLVPSHLKSKDTIYYNYINIKARYLLEKGKTSEAISILEEAITDQNKINHSYIEEALVEKLSEAYILAGDYDKAKEVIIPGIALNADPFIKGRALGKLANIYSAQKNFAEALTTIDLSLKNLSKSKSNEYLNLEYLKRKIDKIEYLYANNQLSSAQEYLDDVIKFKTILPPDATIRCLIMEARLNTMKGLLDIALESAKEAHQLSKLKAFSSSNLNTKSVESALLINEIYIKKNNLKDSEKILKVAFEDIGISHIDSIQHEAHTYNYKPIVRLADKLAYTWQKQFESGANRNKIIDAVSLYETIVKIIARMRNTHLRSSYLGFWSIHNLDIYEKAIHASLLADLPEKALIFMEENKSNLLANSINRNLAIDNSKIPREIINQEQQYEGELNLLRKELTIQRTNSENKKELLVEIGEKINLTQVKLDRLKRNIASSYPYYHNLRYDNRIITINHLQQKLDENTLMLEYFIGQENSYALLIGKDLVKLYPLNNLKGEEKIFIDFTSKIREQNFSQSKYDISNKEISQKLLGAPLNNISEKIKNLIVVPDDHLTNFPIELLLHKNEPIIKRFNIHYQYSAWLWNLLKERPQQEHKLDLHGYFYKGKEDSGISSEQSCHEGPLSDLICSDKEIMGISSMLEDKLFMVNKLNVVNFLQESKNSKILHTATHSCVDTENISRSKIFIGNSYLTLGQIQEAEISNELTVLSSCESGFGKIHQGEGAFSIAKAFFQAGSKSAVVSLWPVDDCSTADIMKYFYKNLALGKDKAESLTNAKKEYLAIAHPSRSHPYYWAGFVLIGNADPLWPSINYTNYIVSGIILLGLVLLFFFNKKRI